MLQDFIYFSTLLTSITLAGYYKKIENIHVKRNYGAVLGILIAFLICGHHLYHSILMIWTNVIIFKCCDRRYIHLVSLVYTWLHLLYLHIHLTNAQYVIWLHQNIALRLVGLAFEMHSTNKPVARLSPSVKISTDNTENEIVEPAVIDIISYAFFFIGLHKGPYYRYKIFQDQLQGSFGVLGDCRMITEDKLKKAFFCLDYSNDKFYCSDADTRYLYNMPQLLMYVLQSQMIMLFCTSVCTEAGFGVYPAKCNPLPGHGPSTRWKPESALLHEFNFTMLKSYENVKLLFGPRMKDTLRSWDMPLRYWFSANIYRNSFRSSKEIRSACSSLAWTLWSGPSLQNIIISSTLWVYVHLESEYGVLYNTERAMKLPWDIGFSIMRMFCLIYLTPCLVITDGSVLLQYYNSIFWVFHVILLVLIVGVIVIHKSRD